MRRNLVRALLAALLGAAAATLVACGSSGKGLIPAAQGGPLASDIEAVEQAAQAGNGNCTETEAKLARTDQDFASLPSSIDSGLRDKIRLGIENLHKVATETCVQPQGQTNTTSTPKTTSTPTTTPTQTTPTTSTPTTTTPAKPVEPEEEAESHGPGGGTPAPGEGPGKAPGEGAGGAAPEAEPPGHADKTKKPKGAGPGGLEGGT